MALDAATLSLLIANSKPSPVMASFKKQLGESVYPMNRTAASFMDQQEAASQVTMASLLQQLQQQSAPQGAAQGLTVEEDPLRSNLQKAFEVFGNQQPVQQEPTFSDVVGRGTDILQSNLYSALALAMDASGTKKGRDWALEKAKEQEAEADTVQRTAPELFGEDGAIAKGNIGRWAKETLAEQLPQLGLGLVTGGVGGAALGKAGALAGLAASTMAQESGGAYATDVKQHGVGGTSPGSDFAVGAANAALEVLGGAESALLRGIFGKSAKSALKTKGSSNIFKQGLYKAIAGGTKEAATEAAQETTALLNEYLHGGVDGDALTRIMESAAAGALVGGPLGIITPKQKAQATGIVAQEQVASPQGVAPISAQQSGIPRALGEPEVVGKVGPGTITGAAPSPFDLTPDSFLDNSKASFQVSPDNDFLARQAGVVASTPGVTEYRPPMTTPQLQAQEKLDAVQRTFKKTKDDAVAIYNSIKTDLANQFGELKIRKEGLKNPNLSSEQKAIEQRGIEQEQLKLAALNAALNKSHSTRLAAIKKQQDNQLSGIAKSLLSQVEIGETTGTATKEAAKELSKLTAMEAKLEQSKAKSAQEFTKLFDRATKQAAEQEQRAKEVLKFDQQTAKANRQEQLINEFRKMRETKKPSLTDINIALINQEVPLAPTPTTNIIPNEVLPSDTPPFIAPVPPTATAEVAKLNKRLSGFEKKIAEQRAAITARAAKGGRPAQVANTLTKMQGVLDNLVSKRDETLNTINSIQNPYAARINRDSNALNPNIGRTDTDANIRANNLDNVSQALNQLVKKSEAAAQGNLNDDALLNNTLKFVYDEAKRNTQKDVDKLPSEVKKLRGENGPLAKMLRHMTQQLVANGIFVQDVEIVDDLANPELGFVSFTASQEDQRLTSIDKVFFNVAHMLMPTKDRTLHKMLSVFYHETLAHTGFSALGEKNRQSILKAFRKLVNTTDFATFVEKYQISGVNFDINNDASIEELLCKLTALPKVHKLIRQRLAEQASGASFTDKLATLWKKIVGMFRRMAGLPLRSAMDSAVDLFDASLSGLLAWAQTMPVDATGTRENSTPNLRFSQSAESYAGRHFDLEREKMSRVERAQADLAHPLNEFPTIKQGWDFLGTKEGRNAFYKSFEETIVDANSPIRRMIKDLKNRTGNVNEAGNARVDVNSNVYKQMEGLPNITNLRLRQGKNVYVDPILKKIAAMAKTYEEDATVTFANATDYLEAVTALERNNYYAAKAEDQSAANIHYLTEVNPVARIKNSKARETIAKLGSPDMDELVQLVQALNSARLDALEKNAIISKETADIWRAAYQHYMPLKGWENVIENEIPSWYKSNTRKSLSTPGDLKKIKARVTGGGDLEAQNPLVKSFMQFYDTITLVEKVKAGRTLLNLVTNNPDASDVFEIVQKRTAENADTWQGIKVRVKDDTGELEVVPTKNSAEGRSEDVVSVIADDSTVVPILIHDPAIAKAFKGANIVQTQGIVRAIGAAQSILARMITSRNPLFWAQNPFRDAATAFFNMGSVTKELRTLGVPSPESIGKAVVTKGMLSAFSKSSVRAALLSYYRTGKMNFAEMDPNTADYMQDLQKFMDYGGQTEYFTTSTYRAITEDVNASLRRMSPANKLQKGKAIVHNMLQYMDNVSDSLENMTRYIAFKEIVDALKQNNTRNTDGTYTRANGKTLTEQEIYSRAANVALNLTVNFSKKGTWAPMFNSLYMFASASIGGNVRMLKTLFQTDENGKLDKANIVRFATVPIAAYLPTAIICRALMPDDEDGINMYDKIPDYIKNTSFIIPSPFMDGTYVKLPLPYSYNILWAMARGVVDSAYGAATGKDILSPTKAATNLIDTAFDNFATIGQTSEGLSVFVPSIFRPLYQLTQNRNFAGAPIKPEGSGFEKGEVPDSERYWSTSNDAVIWMTRQLNSLTGGSKNKSGFIDWSPESIEHLYTAYAGGIGKILAQGAGRLTEIAEGKKITVARMPLAGLFYREIVPQDTTAIFTKYRTAVQTQINEIEGLKTDRSTTPVERMALFNANRAGIALKDNLNSIQRRLYSLRHHEKMLDQSNINNNTKQDRLKVIQDQKAKLMKQFIKRARDAGVSVE